MNAPAAATVIGQTMPASRDEIPSECFSEVMKLELDPEKVAQWLSEQAHEVKPSYSLTVGRKKTNTLKKA